MQSNIRRGIFFHDLPIYRDVDGYYCSTTLTNEMFSRYFYVVDELTVVLRVYPLDVTYEEAHQEKIDTEKIHILSVPNINSPHGFFTSIFSVWKMILEETKKTDYIFIRGGTIARLGVDAARKLKKPYLVECGGCAWDSYWNHSMMGKLVAPYMEYRERRDIKNAAYVIYVTEKWLQKRYPTKGISTHASNVYLSEITDTVLEKRLKKIRLKSTDEDTVIGTVAAVNVRYKGQQYVIEAIKELKRSGRKVRYELVGGGDQGYLRSIAEKNGVADLIIFKGEITHSEVLNWLDSIDIYAQPSRQEGLPRALIEAMSRACPAIGSTTAGIPELLNEDVVFKNGDIRGIFNLLSSFIDNDVSSHSIANYEKAKEYHISNLNIRREKLYKEYRDYVIKNV